MKMFDLVLRTQHFQHRKVRGGRLDIVRVVQLVLLSLMGAHVCHRFVVQEDVPSYTADSALSKYKSEVRQVGYRPSGSNTMKLYCRTYSSGNLEELYQPPIIILHGMGFSGIMYKKIAPILAKRTKKKVYVPDVRNHGKSPWVKEMDYDVLTNDVLELMQQNDIPKSIVIGSSMGGRIAINLALKYPHKVAALVVEDMTPRNIISSGTNVIQVIHKFVQNLLDLIPPDTNLNEAKKNLFENLADFCSLLVDKEKAISNYDPEFIPLVKEGNRFRLECNIDVVAGMLENDALVQNLPDMGATFNGDALFLYGSKGFFNLDKDPSVKKLFPKAIVKRIEGASHLIHFDSPEEYTNIVTNFLLHRNLPQSKY